MARYIVGSVGVYTPKYEGSNDALLKASLVAESSDPLLQSSFPRIEVYRFTEKKISPIMRRTTFQARMGSRLDGIKRKVIDNSIRLASNPTDMIRVRTVRDERSRDLVSRTITESEVLPVILPEMQDIPLRRFIAEDDKSILIPSLYSIKDKAYFDLYCALECDLDIDDLLFRIIKDPGSDIPYIMCLQVKDVLSTISYSSILYSKYQVTFFDEALPSEIINIIRQESLKREKLGW